MEIRVILVCCFLGAFLWGTLRPSDLRQTKLRALVLLAAAVVLAVLPYVMSRAWGTSGTSLALILLMLPLLTLFVCGLGLVLGSACTFLPKGRLRTLSIILAITGPPAALVVSLGGAVPEINASALGGGALESAVAGGAVAPSAD